MADYPFLPMTVPAFLADTQHLDARETGAYVSLIFFAWLSRECGLPDDDKKLARMARCSLREWLQIKTTVMAFWQLMDDGLWHQKKLDQVRSEVTLKSEKARAAAYAKHLNNNNSPSADAQRTHSGRSANHKHKQNLSHGENSTDAPRPPAPNGAASDAVVLTSEAEWQKRVEAYNPSEIRKTWKPAWGPTPDSPATSKLIPYHLVQWWKAKRAEARQGSAA